VKSEAVFVDLTDANPDPEI